MIFDMETCCEITKPIFDKMLTSPTVYMINAPDFTEMSKCKLILLKREYRSLTYVSSKLFANS